MKYMHVLDMSFYCTAIRNLSLMQLYSAVILKYLPDNFLNTLDRLQDHLNDDCICAVRSIPDNDIETANKLMLDCLIESHIEDVIGFCDIIDQISTVINLMDCLREGMCMHISMYISIYI